MAMQSDRSVGSLAIIPAVNARRVGLCRVATVVLAATIALIFPAIAGAESVGPPVVAGPQWAVPSDANEYYVRCSAELDKGDFGRAIEDCGAAIHLKPDFAEARNARCAANVKKAEFDRLANVNRDRYGATLARDLDRAIDDCSDAIVLKSNFAEAYRNRGLARAMKGELERAIRDCSEALRLSPQDAMTFYSRGLAWQSKGQLTHAVDDFAQAHRIDGANTTFKKHLDTAKDAQAALAPGSGPYITDSGLADVFDEVAKAIVPPPDLDKPAQLRRKRQIWSKVGPFINTAGLNPVTAIVNAIHGSRIVGIGEQHDHNESNLNMLMALNHIEDFARAGLTDLFIELPSPAQPIFDKFNDSTSTEAELEIPDDPEQIVRPGVDRDVAEGTLRMLRWFRYVTASQHYQLWRAAKAAGIRLHAIDNASGALAVMVDDGNGNRDLQHVVRILKSEKERDQDMMEAMLRVLDAPAGALRERKGMAWLGALHLADAKAEAADKSAFRLLRAKGQRVTTFFAQVAVNEHSAGQTLFGVARYANRAVAVPTSATSATRNPLSALSAFVVPVLRDNFYSSDYRLDNWDFAILYPHRCTLVADRDTDGQLAC
jgi:hypothetical protein